MIDNTIEEIQEMQTHSSSVVAVKAAKALTDLLNRDHTTIENFERDLERNVGALKRANPSHASLFNAMQTIKINVVDRKDDLDDAKELLEEVIHRVVEDVTEGKSRAAAKAAPTLEADETVLTHDYSSTVLEAIERATGTETPLKVYVTEARPRYLGRKAARRFAELDNVEPHLLIDSAAGSFLSDCDRVVVGMDCIVNDTLYNRVGTFPIVATAAAVDVPVTVIGSAAKVVDGSFVFENEYRSPAEVSLEPLENIMIENPAYDATPVSLIDRVITDNGVESF
ncbi:translation initiation factor eIF-2B [Haloquadratum walsbyi]|jgi:translation initiation factor 2B subunit II family (IF-2BII)|uniref:Translation initiation factor 2B subunit, eIF-2B alpha/beta/delta family n=1 Tax=Haloquadratum walsbyi J07HQW2 TaxID=1238425 RepID=U1NDA1_9EURY|nr:translation initiation factor eIF-2B [Haloquadratum walsbyi]ERG94920.1 MAG: translation initiation factor 2B subunit, eIF-2B alpha/beta/delta family [Haloquadratum walsbyi J07HQW2]